MTGGANDFGGGVAIRDIGIGNVFNNYGTITGCPTTGVHNNGYQGRGASAIFRNYGHIVGTQFSPAVVQLNNSAEVVLVEGTVINGPNYTAIMSFRLTLTDSDDFQWQLKTTTNQDRNLYTAGLLTGYPLEAKVEDGEVFGPVGEFTGTLQPVNIDVQQLASDLLNEISSSSNPLAERLRNVSTVQTTGAQISALTIS
jgi:hypothetical protein